VFRLFLCLLLGFFLQCLCEVVESFGGFFVRPDVVVGVFGFVLAEGACGCGGCFFPPVEVGVFAVVEVCVFSVVVGGE